MKTLHKLIAAGFLVIALANNAAAQNTEAQTLIKQGVQLNDQGKFTEAIEKYQQALKADPTNMQAEFEIGYSLFASGKGPDAVPHLQKVIKTEPRLAAGAYDLLGSVYDDNKEFDKAIDAFKSGISIDPNYQRLYYNMSISYLRQAKNADAANYATQAIKLDPKHASSQRVYALAMTAQNKGVCAIMGFCSFLMLEPQTARSAEAFQYIQKIIQSKVKHNTDGDGKGLTITVNDDKSGDKDMFALEAMLSMTAASPSLEANKNKAPIEILTDQLHSIFGVAGELSAKRTEKDFFWKFYADYFYKLSQTDNLATFVHVISLTTNQPDNIAWLKANQPKLAALDAWVKATPRSF